MADNGELQFDRAEPTDGQTGATCSACRRPISSTYFEINGSVVCPSCREGVEAEWNRGGAAGRLGKAVGIGILATVACSIVWYVVLKLTDSQWGILAVVVGLVVGAAVRKGSNGRGGWRYQALAIFLTYTAIVSSYVPFLIEGIRERAAQEAAQDSTRADSVVNADSSLSADAATTATPAGPLLVVVGVVVLLALLYATPFLAGLENAIGILIIGFALYEAWKLNKKVELTITGPYQVVAAAGGGGGGGGGAQG